MRVKPIFKYGLVAGALALPGWRYPLGLGRLTVDSYVGPAAVGAHRTAVASKEELDTLSGEDRGSFAVSAEQPAIPGCAVAYARHARARSGDTAFLRVTSTAPVTEPYLDLLVEVNWASGRVVRDYTFLLDPPGMRSRDRGRTRSRRCVPAPRPSPRGRRLRRPAPPRRRPPRPPRRAARSGRHVRSEARRHAVQDRQGIQARDGHARPDAGRAVQEQPERVRRQQHEPPALGRDHHDPERGRCVRGGRAPEEATKVVQVQASRLARLSRSRRRRGADASKRPRARAAGGRIGTAVRNARPPRAPGSDQLRVSKDAGSARAPAAAETSRRATRSCAKRKAASPSSRRR